MFNYVRVILISLFLSACTSLGTAPVYEESGVAIEGFDTVAYFEQNKAIKGDSSISHAHNGVNWYFANQNNKDKFIQDPESYLPVYGGYCAYAMSKGFVVSSDPEAFTLYQNKLYLNYSFSVRDTWREDIPGYLKKSEVNWRKKIADVKSNFEE